MFIFIKCILMIWYAIRFYCKDMKKTNSHQSCLFELKWYIISTISILVSECYFLIIGFPQTCTCQDFRAYDYAKHTFLHWKWKKNHLCSKALFDNLSNTTCISKHLKDLESLQCLMLSTLICLILWEVLWFFSFLFYPF